MSTRFHRFALRCQCSSELPRNARLAPLQCSRAMTVHRRQLLAAIDIEQYSLDLLKRSGGGRCRSELGPTLRIQCFGQLVRPFDFPRGTLTAVTAPVLQVISIPRQRTRFCADKFSWFLATCCRFTPVKPL